MTAVSHRHIEVAAVSLKSKIRCTMDDFRPSLSVDLLRRIDAACDRFEESWRSGAMPRIKDYLAPFQQEERPSLLEALQSLQHELLLSQPTGGDSSPMTYNNISISNIADQTILYENPDSPIRSQETPVKKTGRAQVTFKVIEGPHAGLGFDFEEHGTLFAGRLPKAQLRLEKDLHFSRHHFRLEVNPPTCFLMDLHSRNGTFVNGERVNDRYLKDGDIVSGGRTKMVVTIFDPNAQQKRSADGELQRSSPKTSHKEGPSAAPQKATSPVSARNDESPAPSIAGYDLYEQIGAGDLGVVYRAKRHFTQELCALKVLTPAAQAGEMAIPTFLREASVHSQLQHPHIVRFIEMGAAGSNIYQATEFVAAIPWAQLAPRYTPEKRIRIACGLMAQILGALEYAHARSLVHRDVKPGNVLVVKQGDKLQAKLADFGLAKQYTTAGMSQVTRDGDVLGSLPFMSPDQFLNSREARPTCDLYSAGATLYWMLTGQEPIPLEGHPCKFLAILESPPTPIRQHNPAIPEGLAQVVHRALEKTPEKRFASAGEMRYQLRAFAK